MGFLSLIPAKAWEYIAGLVILAAFGGFCYIEGGEAPKAALAAEKASFSAFQAQVKAEGLEAQKETQAKDLANQQAKEQSDEKYTAAQAGIDQLYAAYRKLREQSSGNPGGNGLSIPAPAAGGSSKACFDATAVNSALSAFDEGVTGLLKEGDDAIAQLNAAKDWASQTLQ